MPTVSVVVPTYKRVQYLGRMIDSVVAQTHTDWELIIVDGKSNDGTAELVESYQKLLGDKIVFIEQENAGCCIARNTGIDAARGDFVALLDSDDEFLPTKLEHQMELFDREPSLGFVFGDYSYVDLEGNFESSMFDTKSKVLRTIPTNEIAPNLHICTPDFFSYLLKEYFVATIVGVVRREVLANDIRFLEHDLYGCEWMFYLEIANRCRAGFVDEPLCLHHYVDGSLSRTSRTRNTIYHRRLLKTIIDRFPNLTESQSKEVNLQLANTCSQLGYESYKAKEYGPAMGYFREAMQARPTAASAVHWAQSLLRRTAALDRPGNEPMLRNDAYRNPTSITN